MQQSVCGSIKALEKEVDDLKKLVNPLDGLLPKKIQSQTTKVVHDGVQMAACSPPTMWRTKCGWFYYGSRVTFLEQTFETSCVKCKAIR